MNMRAFDIVFGLLLIEAIWLGWQWATFEPTPEVKPWRPFTVSFGEQGPCWRSRYEVVCSYTPPWRQP